MKDDGFFWVFRRSAEAYTRDVACEELLEEYGEFVARDGDGWFDLYVSNMDSAAGQRVAYQREFQPGASEEVSGGVSAVGSMNALDGIR